MTNPGSPQPDDRPKAGPLRTTLSSVELLAMLDDLADQFESDWSPDRPDRLAELAGRAPPALRGDLVRELVRLEIELRQRRGLPADLADYLRRFPELLEDDGWPADDLVVAAGRPPRKARSSAAAVAARADVPKQIGPYRVERYRSISLHPAVYDAVEPASGRAVLLSVYPPMTRADVERAHRAALAVAECREAGVPAVLNVGRADGCLYVVQDRPAGATLADLAAQPGMTWRRAAQLSAAVARAVAGLHARSAAHGAITPESVVVDSSGAVRLIGLPPPPGSLGQTVSPDDPRLPHLCPENAWRFQQADARPADIFAVGAILYHLLAGRPLYAGERPKDALDKALACSWEEAPLDRLSPPKALRDLLRKALERNPDLRHPWAETLAQSLEPFAGSIRRRGCGAMVAAWLLAVGVAALAWTVVRGI
jgi:serine/threonine-protein kinase